MFLALFGTTSGSTEVKTVKDAIFLTKAKDVVVMGLFGSKKSDELKVFKAVSKQFPTVAPVDFSHSFSPEVIERYAEETQGRSPAVLVFRRFDEEGKPKRKQYTFAFNGDAFTEEALAHFVFKSSIPLVPSVGNVQGDQKMRWQLAMLSRLPKFVFFSTEEAVHQDFLACARSHWGEATFLHVSVAPQGRASEDELAATDGLLQAFFGQETDTDKLRREIHKKSQIVALDEVDQARTSIEWESKEDLDTFATEFIRSRSPRSALDLTLDGVKKKVKKNKKKKGKKPEAEL